MGARPRVWMLLGATLIAAIAGAAPRHDLGVDEDRGGHTLARHVGRTDAELRERLRHEPRITAASTYTDRATAELVVGLALDRERDRLIAWTARRGSRPNLVLHVEAPRGPPIGRVLERGSPSPVPATSAIVVLRWDDEARSFFVLTSYPEARE